MKKLVYCLSVLIVLGVVINFIFPSISSGKDLPKLTANEIFTQSEENYLVYFYQDTCSFCQELNPTIVETYATKTPMYAVDMAAEENSSLWYDWENHHVKYDVELGTIVGGEEVLHEGINKTDYPSSEWSIQTSGDKIIAANNKAKNNRNPQSPDEIEISGTPVIFHIQNGELKGIAEGLEEARNMLRDIQKDPFINGKTPVIEELVEEEPIELGVAEMTPTPIEK